VHDRHQLGEPGEERRLFHRGVAAADHDDVVVAEEEAVTLRTGRDTVAEQRLLAGHAQRPPRGTGGEGHGAGEELLVADPDGLEALGAGLGRLVAELDPGDVVGEELGAGLLGWQSWP
jgi:hypothetical protein